MKITVSPPGFPNGTTPRAWRILILVWVNILAFLAWEFAEALGPRGQAALGILCFFSIPAALSANLRAVNWRTIGWGIVLQVSLALLILRFKIGDERPIYQGFQWVGQVVTTFLTFADEGSRFVFGALADQEALGKVFPNRGFVFAFTALPTVIFVSSVFTVLYHLRVLQFVVRVMARGMMYLMRTSGAETLSAAANVFMGQTEAPLIVKPYIEPMTESELLTVMVGGMATIAGGVMAVYIQLGADSVAILATSVMAAPCSLYLSKLILPETGVPQTSGSAQTADDSDLYSNVVDAAASGASEGMKLAINIAAMLIAFLAIIAMINHGLGLVGSWLSLDFPLSLQWIFSYLFAPLAYLMGVEPKDVPIVADLLGTKLVANEFVAYLDLTGKYKADLSPRSYRLATYALTGFANVASIGIQLGGIGALAPTRRADLARLGWRALLVGFLATLLNASIAGVLMED